MDVGRKKVVEEKSVSTKDGKENTDWRQKMQQQCRRRLLSRQPVTASSSSTSSHLKEIYKIHKTETKCSSTVKKGVLGFEGGLEAEGGVC